MLSLNLPAKKGGKRKGPNFVQILNFENSLWKNCGVFGSQLLGRPHPVAQPHEFMLIKVSQLHSLCFPLSLRLFLSLPLLRLIQGLSKEAITYLLGNLSQFSLTFSANEVHICFFGFDLWGNNILVHSMRFAPLPISYDCKI